MPNVTITLNKPALDAAKAQAAAEFRSLSQHVAFLIQCDTTRRVSAATDSAARRATPRKTARKGAKAA